MSKTRILCLHGAQLSADIFKMQLAPYLYRLEKEENCTFYFINGPIPTASHESVTSFYDGPCYRYFHWAPSPTPFALSQVSAACAYLRQILREEGPFDGVVGFSQGAVMSVALALEHEAQAAAATGPAAPPTPPFRFAVLFSCPYLPYPGGDRDAAEWGAMRVPSLHVAGRRDDEWFEGSRAVARENCVDGTATLLVHDGGHVVPRDPETVGRVSREIARLVRESREV